MKNIRKLLFSFFIIILFLVSCNKGESIDENNNGSINWPFNDFVNCHKFVFGSQADLSSIHYDTEGYNYYGDFKILFNNEVVFDMADYDYFLPATNDLSISITTDSSTDNVITLEIGENFIKTASEKVSYVGVIDHTYRPGNIEVLSGFDNNVTITNDIELVEGKSKFIFKGYNGYLYIDNENVTVSREISWELNSDEVDGVRANVFDVEAKSPCVVSEEDIKYSSNVSMFDICANENGELLNIDSNVILTDINQSVTYLISDNPLANEKTLYIDFDSRISIKNISLAKASSFSILNKHSGMTTIKCEFYYPSYASIDLELTSIAGVKADIIIYK